MAESFAEKMKRLGIVPTKDVFLCVGGLSSGSVVTSSVEKINVDTGERKACSPVSKPVMSAGIVTLDNFVYVLGGINVKNGPSQSTTYKYDFCTDVWTLTPSLRQPLQRHVAVIFNDNIYVIGGIGIDNTLIDSVDVFNYQSNVWERCSTLPTPRYGCAAVVIAGGIYVIGGATVINQKTIHSNVVERYNPDTNDWDICTSMNIARLDATATVSKRFIYVMGGTSIPRGDSINKIERFNTATNVWSPVTDMPIPRTAHSAVSRKGFIYVAGGITRSTLDTIDSMNSADDRWMNHGKMSLPRKYFGFVIVTEDCKEEQKENPPGAVMVANDNNQVGPITNALLAPQNSPPLPVRSNVNPVGPITNAILSPQNPSSVVPARNNANPIGPITNAFNPVPVPARSNANLLDPMADIPFRNPF